MKDADNKTPTPTIPFGPTRMPWEGQVPPIAVKGEGGWHISPPWGDPTEVYARRSFEFPEQIAAVPNATVELPPTGTTIAQQEATRKTIATYITTQRANFLGYQTEERFNYSATLAPYLDTLLNNIGDPFVDGYFTVNAKFAERAVLDFYASLWNAVWPSEGPYVDPKGNFQKGNPESYWGYVLTMGSSEGNLYGMFNARDYLRGRMLLEEFIAHETQDGETVVTKELVLCEPTPPKDNPNAYTPVAFYSEDTHYSIIKAMGVLVIATFYDLGSTLFPDQCPIKGDWQKGENDRSWPQEVPSAPAGTDGCPIGPGSVDVDALVKLVEFFAAKGYPAIVVCNYGTTFKGAYDPVEKIGDLLMPIFKTYGLYEREVYPDPDDKKIFSLRSGYWIHVDGALGASYGNFLRMAKESGLAKTAPPKYDFSLPYVHSVVTSGHKWPGAPWPTGIYMTKQKYMVMPPDNPEYIGSPDTTFAGSRNGFSAMILWQYLAATNYNEITIRALRAQGLAAYAMHRLAAVNKHWSPKMDIWEQRSPDGLSIIYRKPNARIVAKYSLCTESVVFKGKERTYVHFFVMGDVEEALVDSMIEDLMAPDAFDKDSTEKPVPTLASIPANALGAQRPVRRVYRVPSRGRGFR